jgi:PAS domain S-box-containing protein
MSKSELDKLVAVVDEIDPSVLTQSDIDAIKIWGADKAGFVLVDIETQKVIYATPGAEAIFGYVTDEMAGLDLIELVPENYRHGHVGYVQSFGQAMQTRSMGRRDTVLYGRERSGQTFPVEIGLFPRVFRKRKLCLANVVRLSKEA